MERRKKNMEDNVRKRRKLEKARKEMRKMIKVEIKKCRRQYSWRRRRD